MGSVEVRRFLKRAEDFLEGMQLLREDQAYPNSSALLGIHSAVSYTDAIRVGLGETTLTAEDHQTAANALGRLLSARGVSDDGKLRNLKEFLSKKSAIAYGRHELEISEFELIFTRSERFATWANTLGVRLHIGGWKHGDQ